MKKITSTQDFKRNYYHDIPGEMPWQDTPVQVYPLAQHISFLKLPTALIKIDYHFLLFIESGSMVHQVGNEVHTLEGPTVLYVTAGSIIAVEKIVAPLKGYFILMEDKVMSLVLSNQNALGLITVQSLLKVTENIQQWFNHISFLLYEELTQQTPNPEVAHGLVQALLNKYLQLADTNKIQSRTELLAYQFKQLVYKHFMDHKSPQYYADALHISANYLNRCVKNVFNKNAKILILEIVILNSQLLMWNKDKSIAEISYELNFEDPSYFARLFKKITGQTPSEYQLTILHSLS